MPAPTALDDKISRQSKDSQGKASQGQALMRKIVQ